VSRHSEMFVFISDVFTSVWMPCCDHLQAGDCESKLLACWHLYM